MPDLRCAIFLSLLCLVMSDPLVAAGDYNSRVEALPAEQSSLQSRSASDPPPPLPATTTPYLHRDDASVHHPSAEQPPAELTQNSAGRTVGGPALRSKSPKQKKSSNTSALDRMKGLTGGRSVSTVLSGLAIVLGAFFLLAWAIRRGMPNAMSHLPNDVIEVLGRATLTAKQSVHLVRLGNKLLLISITPTGAETLAEVTDPDEVTRLIGLCGQFGHGKSQTAFRKVFEELGHGRANGFLGNDSSACQSA